jgi:hypothetical protein
MYNLISSRVILGGLATAVATLALVDRPLDAQLTPPSVVDPRLDVRTAVSGFVTPVSLAFIGANDMLVLEKNTGRVQRVLDGVQSTAIDLAVNNASERGLLGVALHPNFPGTPYVYLYWTCRTFTSSPDRFTPAQEHCDDTQMLGPDTGATLDVPLRGNRVDRFLWNGARLTYDRNLVTLRAFQSDGALEPPNQEIPPRTPRAITTEASFASAQMASSTSSLATTAGVGGCRICSRARRRRPTTISSAVRSRTMRT